MVKEINCVIEGKRFTHYADNWAEVPVEKKESCYYQGTQAALVDPIVKTDKGYKVKSRYRNVDRHDKFESFPERPNFAKFWWAE